MESALTLTTIIDTHASERKRDNVGVHLSKYNLYLDDVVSQSTEFILRNLVQNVFAFQNTPSIKVKKTYSLKFLRGKLNTPEAPLK